MSQHPGLKHLETLPLESPGRGKQTRPYQLTVPERLLERFGNPQNKVPAIHVAGTNGKGSVCTYLSAMLYAAGCHVGQFASPHLVSPTERCLIDGAPVSEKEFGETILEVADAARSEALVTSYFELVTVVSFLIFARRKLDWMVIEVGLGGRLDATNLIEKAQAAVITSIDFDHTHVLGNTLSQIAKEKAGIVKTALPVFTGALPSEAVQAVEEACQASGVRPEVLGRDFEFRSATREMVCRDGRFSFDPGWLKERADYQVANAALAVRVAKSIGIDDAAISLGLATARWPGRVEHVVVERDGKTTSILLDVAHNAEGVRVLIDYLDRFFQDSQVTSATIVLSALVTKDWSGMLELLRQFSEKLQATADLKLSFIFTRSAHPNSADPGDFLSIIPDGRVIDDPRAALTEALSAATKAGSVVIVTGSLFLVGQLRPLLVDEPFRTIDKSAAI